MSRRSTGFARILVGLLTLITIVVQITDRVVNNAFSAALYFGFFTTQTALIAIVVLLVGGWMALVRTEDTVLYTSVRLALVVYAIISAAVYNLTLRGIPYDGYQALDWPVEFLHVWLPLVILLDWLLSPGRPALSFGTIGLVIVYPLAWVAVILTQAQFTGRYPYPFLDPANGGWVSVVAYVIGLSAIMLAIAAAALLYGRVRAATQPPGESATN